MIFPAKLFEIRRASEHTSALPNNQTAAGTGTVLAAAAARR